MLDTFIHQVETEIPGIEFKKDAAISHLTAFKSGGSARIFVAVDTIDALTKIVMAAWANDISFRILGGGTNSIIPTGGFDGLIIKNNCRKFDLQGMKGKFSNNQMKLSQAFLYAESGAITNQVVRYMLDQGFGGIEYALGLPGTVGGAVAVNANFPKENIRIGRAVYAAKILTKDRGIIDVDNDYLHFAEDSSRLLSDREVLLSVLFALYPEDKSVLWKRADDAVAYRTGTQPKMLMAGMTFRNMTLKNLYPNSSLPADVTAAFLLDKAGLLGYRVGDVEVWDGNPHYLINRGKGSLEDMQSVLKHLKETLFRKYGVQLDVYLHSIA